MKSVLLQGPTRTIGRQAFKGCSSLERVDVRGKIERLDFAFTVNTDKKPNVSFANIDEIELVPKT